MTTPNQNTTTAVQQKAPEQAVTYTPFGVKDPIKLSLQIVRNFIAVPTKSGALPTDRDLMKFMMLCKTRLLNPFDGDAYLVGYDGKDGPTFSLITAHQAFLKRAEEHPQYDGMTSGIIILNEDSGVMTDREGDFHLPDEKVVGGWATVYRKDRSRPIHRRLRTERFNKGMAEWAKDPAGMICKCAEADALRSSFPNSLGGMYTGDEATESPWARVVDTEISNAKPVLDSAPVKQIEAPKNVTPMPTVAQPAAQPATPAPAPKPAAPVPASTYPPKKQEVPKPGPNPTPMAAAKAAAPAPKPAAKPTPPPAPPAPPAPAPEPEPEPATETAAPEAEPAAEPPITDETQFDTQRADLYAALETGCVSFSDFRDWLKNSGRYEQADTLNSVDEIPAEVLQMIADPKIFGKCVKMYAQPPETFAGVYGQ
jgi:phage recombination protein Bet